jgi:uncharacterized protein
LVNGRSFWASATKPNVKISKDIPYFIVKDFKNQFENNNLISNLIPFFKQKIHLYLHVIKVTVMEKRKYMNPYWAGTLLGLVLLSSMFLSGRGLGASGGMKYLVVAAVGSVDKEHAMNTPFYSKYFEGGKKPALNWLSIELFGLLIGGFISGAVSGRLKLKTDKSAKIRHFTRFLFAFLGGLLFVYGAQLARGCTSGAALSGMAVLSVAGFVTMMAIFGSAYLFAWFFRKLWI